MEASCNVIINRSTILEHIQRWEVYSIGVGQKRPVQTSPGCKRAGTQGQLLCKDAEAAWVQIAELIRSSQESQQVTMASAHREYFCVYIMSAQQDVRSQCM